MDKLNLDWFFALQRREQWMLLLGSIALLGYLYFVLLWRPLADSNDALRERNASAAHTLQWMHNSAAIIERERTGTSPSSSSAKSISQLLNASVANNGLRFSRFQPRGNDKAQVWFENVNFAQLFLWLAELQKQNVLVAAVSVSSTSQNGLVSASLQLQKSG